MKILVTGGTGHVGSEVVKELQKRNADVRILVRKEESPAPEGVQVIVGDLLDPEDGACSRICSSKASILSPG
jgi:uncharacterized protein YbjT (DUF2867 family)